MLNLAITGGLYLFKDEIDNTVFAYRNVVTPRSEVLAPSSSIKNAEALEHMEKVNTSVVDKTGTSTQGHPAVTAIVPAGGFGEEDISRLTAAVEQSSEHPSALAIVEAAKARNIALSSVSEFDSPTGRGALGTVEGKRIVIGNARFSTEQGIDTAALAAAADDSRRDGATAIFVGIDGQAGGAIAIADPVKPTTPEALEGLRREGIRVVMSTGDNRTTAEAVARKSGIDEVEAAVSPDQKSAVVTRLKAAGRAVAMATVTPSSCPRTTVPVMNSSARLASGAPSGTSTCASSPDPSTFSRRSGSIASFTVVRSARSSAQRSSSTTETGTTGHSSR
ncbi:hypothetical protein OY671_007819 [Metschnikowia pulcherrima]|nr:hypothetical protein OY671_007819 [Metschnikowia pulcherrima]